MTPTPIPSVRLNNGVVMPQVGFGVFQIPDDDTTTAVTEAIRAGYRSIDTAAIYGNETGTGRAITEYGIKQSGIARDDLFVTTKLWNADQGYNSTLRAFEASLSKLGLEYLDLYLIHWPAPETDRYLDTWRAFEKLYADGLVRAIGVSNFLPDHLERILDLGGTVPAVNQIELHPALQQREASSVNAANGILTEAWSPLAQGGVLDDPIVTAIASRLHRTPAQVVLRWHVQHGRIIIPKSVTPRRIAQNLDLFDFALSEQDLVAISGLERNGRIGPDPAEFGGTN